MAVKPAFLKKKSGKLYLSNALVKRTKQAKNERKIILIQLPDPDLPKLTMFEAHTHHTGKLKSIPRYHLGHY